MDQDIRFLPMSKKHLKSLAQLEEICFSQPWSLKSLTEELSNPLGVFRVAMNSTSEVLGYIGMHHVSGECYITNVAVFPQYRGQGLAKALVGQLVDWALEHKCSFITLEVRPSNIAAISLYEKLGFVHEGLRCNYYRNPLEDGLLMTKWFT